MKKVSFLLIALLSFHQNILSGPNFSKILDTVFNNKIDEIESVSDIDSHVSGDENLPTDQFSRCIQAICSNKIGVIQDILSKQPDIIFHQDENGLTVLHHALISQNNDNKYQMNEQIISILLNSGADTEIEDYLEGTSPRSLVEIYKTTIEKDFTATSDDYDRVARIYGSVSPDRPQYIRKRFAN
jgi:ankyrin repeat protein